MADVHLIPITASVVQSSSMRGLGWAILLLLLPKQLIIVGITTSKAVFICLLAVVENKRSFQQSGRLICVFIFIFFSSEVAALKA